MAVSDAVVTAVIGIILIEGIWLIALTYLMWRRRQAEKAGPAPEAQAPPPK